jgi:hypothetical protein
MQALNIAQLVLTSGYLPMYQWRAIPRYSLGLAAFDSDSFVAAVRAAMPKPQGLTRLRLQLLGAFVEPARAARAPRCPTGERSPPSSTAPTRLKG